MRGMLRVWVYIYSGDKACGCRAGECWMMMGSGVRRALDLDALDFCSHSLALGWHCGISVREMYMYVDVYKIYC